MSFRSHLASWTCRWPLWLGTAALATLAACGGDTSRVQAYAPTQLVVFGDEHSLLTSTGAKYTVNSLSITTNAVDCTLGPIWVQTVATGYNFVFPECNPNAVTPTVAVNKAAVGARVATVRQQVAAFKAANPALGNTTLVTVMVGMYDVLDAYQAYDAGTLTREHAMTQLATAGASLGSLVNELTDGGKGARVIYATVADIGYSPYALAEQAAKPGVDRAQLLKDMVGKFNEAYRLQVVNEGQWAALVIVDDIIGAMVKNPSLYSFSNVVDAACLSTAALPDCTSATLVPNAGGSTTNYLWADNLRFGMTVQTRIGSIAFARARSNPF